MLRRRIDLPDPDATDRLARALAPRLRAGDTLLLSGDLGAGKSHLARQVIQTRQAPYGAVEHVPSPTYTLLQTYRAGPVELVHADLYRLGDPDELTELGLEEMFGTAICLIEWPERLDPAPKDALTIRIDTQGAGRRATLSGPGDPWAERLDGLDAAHA